MSKKIYTESFKIQDAFDKTFLFRFMSVTTSFSARSEEELDPEVIKDELDKSSKY